MKIAAAASVRVTAIVGTLVLCGCARDAGHGVPEAAKPAATAPASKPASPASAVAPSYEVAIASAQADRVHALNGCDDKQGAPRVACVRAADKEYDEARETAEKIRGSGGR